MVGTGLGTGRFATTLLVLAAVVLAGCGGGSDDGDESDDGETDQVTGDDAVDDGDDAGDDAGDEGDDGSDVEAPLAVEVRPGTLAIVGDAGELNDDTLAVARLVAEHGAAAVFTVGDNEYTTEGRTVESFAESVGDVYGPWLETSSFFPIPGDHDYGDNCGDGDADLDAYLSYFDLPVGPEDETYYDVRLGDVHVFALDSLVDCHGDDGAKLERERAWLESTATASDAPLKIALLHNPPYSSGTSHGSFEELRWPFGEWGIDLAVSGDDHIYERSTHDGVVYVVNGLGGIEAHELGDAIDGSEVLFADAFGAMFVTTSSTGARARFVTVDGDEVDAFELDGGDDGRDRFGESSATTAVTTVAAGESGAADAAGESGARLDPGSTWTWQLLGDIDTSIDVDVYDIDLFDTPAAVLDELHDAGRVVVCYFSAGSYEEWRPDADDFDPGDLGDPLDGWEGERWLDVRSPSVRSVLEGRLDLARERGCDGVEPDNVDGHANSTGFDLAAADQLEFNRWLARAAHERGLLVGLKNDLDQLSELVAEFDFAVVEQCHEFDECDLVVPMLDDGKPVFVAEYADEYVDDPSEVCAAALDLGTRTLVLPIDLDGSFRIDCDEFGP